MNIQDLDPESLDLLIANLREQHSRAITGAQSQKLQTAAAKLIVILEDELVGEEV